MSVSNKEYQQDVGYWHKCWKKEVERVVELSRINAQLLEALREIIESGVYPDCPACEIMYEIADNAIAAATGDDKDNDLQEKSTDN